MMNRKNLISNKGFTLIELMIAMAISFLVIGGAYTFYRSQTTTTIVQQEIIGIQQNLRAAALVVSKNIRKIGYSPYGKDPNVGIQNCCSDSELSFSYIADYDGKDNDNDGNEDELNEINTIQFDLYHSTEDSGSEIGSLGMITSGAQKESIASNIDKMEFVYLDDEGKSVNKQDDIRAIQLTLLGRSERENKDEVKKQTFTSPSGKIWTFTDGYKRQLLTTIVYCRNLGLE